MLPFYRTFPLPDYYKNEDEYAKDLVRMKELYPKDMQMMQLAVEERCDELEYEGSFIYDEVPDRQLLELEADKISKRFMSQQSSNCPLCSIIGLLFNSEVCRRRCRYRRYRRFW